jgi:hypothetical protein
MEKCFISYCYTNSRVSITCIQSTHIPYKYLAFNPGSNKPHCNTSEANARLKTVSCETGPGTTRIYSLEICMYSFLILQSDDGCTFPNSIQGEAVNRGLKRFFSLYRPLHLIEAYVWPEKYWLVWAGPLANHLFILTSFFLATA